MPITQRRCLQYPRTTLGATKKVPQSERTVRGTVLDGLTVRRAWPGIARQWDPSPGAEDET